MKLYEWLCANKLTLNIAKTNYCLFHRGSKKKYKYFNEIKIGKECVKKVTHTKYLGVIVDDRLKWKCHIEKIVTGLTKTCSTFKFMRKYVPNRCKKQLYYAYVYSKITYGIEVYSHTSKCLIDKLQVMQNRLLKILYMKDWYTNTNMLHKQLNLLKVEEIAKLFILKFVQKCKMGEVPSIFSKYYKERTEIHSINTRNVKKYEIPRYKTTTYGHRTIRYIGSKLYNMLPIKIKDARTMNLFSAEVKKLYIESY